MTEKYDQAETDYMAGMKYKDIALKYGVSLNTVKTWKRRYGWQRGPTKKGEPPKPKGVHTKSKKGAHKTAPKVVDDLEANNELTEKQKLFCLFYLQRFNATWAYQQAYKCSYETAMVNGFNTLRNTKIKKQLAELKQQQQADLYLTADGVLREYVKQAFSSLGDVLDYKSTEELILSPDGSNQLDVHGKPIKRHVTDIYLKPSDEIDWSTVQEIHRGKDGLVVKLYDKQKAMKELIDRLPEEAKTMSKDTLIEALKAGLALKKQQQDSDEKGDGDETKSV